MTRGGLLQVSLNDAPWNEKHRVLRVPGQSDRCSRQGGEQDNAEHPSERTRTSSCRTSDRLSVGRPLFNPCAWMVLINRLEN